MKPLSILLTLLLLLSGCETGVVSKNPLSSPHSAMRDPRIEGLWRARDGSGYEYIAYGAHGSRGANLIVKFGKTFANDPTSDQLGWSNTMNFFVTRTKKHNYLNVNNNYDRNGTDTEPTVNEPDYKFLEYHFTSRGDLILSDFKDDPFSKAVAAGKLKGKAILELNNYSYMYLTDSSAHILSFTEAANPREIFVPILKLTKIGSP